MLLSVRFVNSTLRMATRVMTIITPMNTPINKTIFFDGLLYMPTFLEFDRVDLVVDFAFFPFLDDDHQSNLLYFLGAGS